ncbi:MAG: hypothetical protein K2N69_07355 [Helicobacter sp.]|nr:hypothetical protein [Helicobacter sp.]
MATNRVEHSKTVDCNAKLAMTNLESLVFLVEMLCLNLAMTDNENFTFFQSRLIFVLLAKSVQNNAKGCPEGQQSLIALNTLQFLAKKAEF